MDIVPILQLTYKAVINGLFSQDFTARSLQAEHAARGSKSKLPERAGCELALVHPNSVLQTVLNFLLCVSETR